MAFPLSDILDSEYRHDRIRRAFESMGIAIIQRV